ncbi:MAG: DegT/DnrJ/EryC1/StrS family aminotransferase, partial [Bacteroidales bacterium]|nr:DegT/DnrJ/EryC1/StrS family aminotransferase [Bacteroidales bacterium]
FNISPEAIEKAISPRTRAIIPVHLFGQSADMEEIIRIARKYNLYIIEDAAQALGTEYIFSDGSRQKAGTIGDIGCTSFFPSKNLGCFGDGGAIFTDDDRLAKRMRSITNHGSTIKYYHDDVGVNSRLDTLQAAVLRVKLRYLDEYNRARRNAASFYDSRLAPVSRLEIPLRSDKSTHIFHQYTIKTDPDLRDELKDFLAGKNIPTMVYYPVPMHLQKAYLREGMAKEEFPVTNELCSSVLSLPMHTELNIDQLQYICDHIDAFFKNS